MRRLFIDRPTIKEFLARLNASYNQPARLYLVGDSIQVYEGWSEHTHCLEFFSEIPPENRERFDQIVQELSVEMGVDVCEESPLDVIPLPKGHRERIRPIRNEVAGPLEVFYYDPYSVSIRLITRGDEPDYRTVLAFLKHHWISEDTMGGLLDDLLPQFTKESIAQDPAEFRRKYRGLLQMWRSIRQNEAGSLTH